MIAGRTLAVSLAMTVMVSLMGLEAPLDSLGVLAGTFSRVSGSGR